MSEFWNVIRLTLVLAVFALLLIAANVYLGSVPVLGALPGDFELDFPGGYIFMPVMTSVLVAAAVALVAYILTASNNDH